MWRTKACSKGRMRSNFPIHLRDSSFRIQCHHIRRGRGGYEHLPVATFVSMVSANTSPLGIRKRIESSNIVKACDGEDVFEPDPAANCSQGIARRCAGSRNEVRLGSDRCSDSRFKLAPFQTHHRSGLVFHHAKVFERSQVYPPFLDLVPALAIV